MTIRAQRPARRAAILGTLALAATLAPTPGCKTHAPPPDTTAGIETYFGTWTQNGTSGTQDATKTLVIDAERGYSLTVRQYETTAKLELAAVRGMSATVTHVQDGDVNPDYQTLLIEVHSMDVTPRNADQAAEWNNDEYGGVTTWIQQDTRTFDESNPGTWEHGAIWQDHLAVSVRREGDLLNVNERGGFDGQDPPEDVYFLEP